MFAFSRFHIYFSLGLSLILWLIRRESPCLADTVDGLLICICIVFSDMLYILAFTLYIKEGGTFCFVYYILLIFAFLPIHCCRLSPRSDLMKRVLLHHPDAKLFIDNKPLSVTKALWRLNNRELVLLYSIVPLLGLFIYFYSLVHLFSKPVFITQNTDRATPSQPLGCDY